ncbi:putative NAD dependent epimerase/dehydratase [Gymnopus androsaceus JB14]|uniref:NAD dependent epimerase/dehydratase n=1 Tax=Gymnopus androsaceus JB14 TaxID=1447944 RepID=A0A6A4HNJ4_9AGAR|nr:putative NAD dependent epimerase/dehydratase [Gymnopus androsaceus JB14]
MATSAKQHIFMTGAHGYIGSVITEFAIAEGYTVTGLSRSETSDAKLRSLVATPVRGDISTYDVLTRESANADIVIHLAGTWRDHPDNYSEVVREDGLAVDAIVKGLKGSGKPFLVTSGTLATAPNPNGGETSESSPLREKPLNDRIASERYALSKAAENVNVVAMRLAPYVYGRAGSTIRLLMVFASNSGEVTYVDEGSVKITTVHVEDAARAYLLAAKKGRAGEAYNVTYETDVTFRQLSEAMGQVLGLPVYSRSLEEMVNAGWIEFLVKFISTESRGSNAKAKKELGWEPKGKGILEEVTLGSYVELAKGLKPAALKEAFVFSSKIS